MRMHIKASFFWIFIIACSLLTCNKDEIQAEDSMVGDWNVVAISSQYGEFFENSTGQLEVVEESGQLGSFTFTEDAVEFSFTRNDSLFAGNGAWDIMAESVREGFTRAPEFTLNIDDQFTFDVDFEDSTTNAEKDATTATFFTRPISGLGVAIQLSLEKN